MALKTLSPTRRTFLRCAPLTAAAVGLATVAPKLLVAQDCDPDTGICQQPPDWPDYLDWQEPGTSNIANLYGSVMPMLQQIVTSNANLDSSSMLWLAGQVRLLQTEFANVGNIFRTDQWISQWFGSLVWYIDNGWLGGIDSCQVVAVDPWMTRGTWVTLSDFATDIQSWLSGGPTCQQLAAGSALYALLTVVANVWGPTGVVLARYFAIVAAVYAFWAKAKGC
jgi:hypothetical protein